MEQSFGHVIPTDRLQVASECQLQKPLCTKQDIVLAMPFQAMQALACLSYNGNVFAFVQLLDLVEDAEHIGACLWKESNKQCLVPAQDILCPLIYNKDKGKVKTLIPWQVRRFLKKWNYCLCFQKHLQLAFCCKPFWLLVGSLIGFCLQINFQWFLLQAPYVAFDTSLHGFYSAVRSNNSRPSPGNQPTDQAL